MSLFPLYETMLSSLGDLKNKKLTPLQKKDLAKKLSTVSQETQEFVYCLISKHSELNKENGVLYESVKTDSTVYKCINLEFDLNKLPILLQNILYKFMEVHHKNKD